MEELANHLARRWCARLCLKIKRGGRIHELFGSAGGSGRGRVRRDFASRVDQLPDFCLVPV